MNDLSNITLNGKALSEEEIEEITPKSEVEKHTQEVITDIKKSIPKPKANEKRQTQQGGRRSKARTLTRSEMRKEYDMEPATKQMIGKLVSNPNRSFSNTEMATHLNMSPKQTSGTFSLIKFFLLDKGHGKKETKGKCEVIWWCGEIRDVEEIFQEYNIWYSTRARNQREKKKEKTKMEKVLVTKAEQGTLTTPLQVLLQQIPALVREGIAVTVKIDGDKTELTFGKEGK